MSAVIVKILMEGWIYSVDWDDLIGFRTTGLAGELGMNEKVYYNNKQSSINWKQLS